MSDKKFNSDLLNLLKDIKKDNKRNINGFDAISDNKNDFGRVKKSGGHFSDNQSLAASGFGFAKRRTGLSVS